MKKLLFLLLIVTGTANAQIINFPDPNFKHQLIYASTNYGIASTQTPDANGNVSSYNVIDTNGDGEIQVSEALVIKSLTINQSVFAFTVTDITGIEFFQGLMALKCGGTNISNFPISTLVNLIYLQCYNNQFLTNINLSTLVNLNVLDCSNNYQLTSLDVTSLINLTKLTCNYNNLTNLNLTGLYNIQYLECSFNDLSNLNLTNQVNLQTLSFGYNLLTNINLSNQVNLQNLWCPGNLLTSIDVSSLVNLTNLNCSNNQLTSLNVNNLTQLTHLDCFYNLITNLGFNNVPSLLRLDCSHNHLTSLDVTSLISLNNLYCGNNNLTNLNLNNNTNLDLVDFIVNPLETVFMKNGHPQYYPYVFSLKNTTSSIDISTTPVHFICIDDINEANYWQSIFQNTTVCNDYCSFSIGGNHNTITGTILFDANNNGCDTSDLPQSNIRVNINDGTTQGASFTSLTGIYNFFTSTGNFIISPDIDNPSWFNFSPITSTIPFVNNNNNSITQDFCITANGIHNDVEVIIVPITTARPGFDAEYKIVYKNKGNQTLSGAINFSYNDAVLDYVSSTIIPNTQATGSLTWNYANLLPFESRSFDVVLNVNSPTETPAVNIGDVLNFNATINPVSGDETTADNVFAFNQTVLGAYDPNDKTCLEGAIVSSAKIGDYLHYNINFENTGNSAAQNIVVKDVIDTTKFDINSLQIMDSSNPMTAKMSGNKVEFVFQNINLGASQHGNVTFKIKTLSSLAVGSSVTNKADIYFDYNFPVATNSATTTFQTLSSGEFELDTSVKVYPNPAKNNVNINCNSTIKSIELFDIQGRILTTKIVDDSISNFDISTYSNGVYFLKITTEKGSKVEKVIKE